MKKTLNNREASVLPKLQPFFPQEGMASVAVFEDCDSHPKAWIKGESSICSVAGLDPEKWRLRSGSFIHRE
jgi:hypothetical protein